MSDDKIYCICRSSDVSRFMIACDKCEEWFHGDCVKVSEKESKYIKSYFCKKCQIKNPKLSIIYKSKYKDLMDEKRKEKHSSENSHDRDKKEKKKETEEERAKRKEKEREREKALKRLERDREEKRKIEKKEKHREKEREREKSHRRSRSRSKDRKDKKEHKDKHRHHGEDRHREREKVQVKKEPESESSSSSSSSDESHRVKKEKVDTKPIKAEPDQTLPAIKRERSDSADVQKVSVKEEPAFKKSKFNDSFETKEESIDESDEVDDDDDWKPAPVEVNSISSAQKKPAKDKGAKKPSKSSANFNKPRSTKRGRRPVNDDTTSSDDFTVDRVSTVSNSIATPMQCYGHKCRHMARPGSKYCSDNCGINLATLRILQTLPDRIREWNMTPCEAEKRNRKELDKIREKQDQVKTRLDQLNLEFHQLEELISRGKSHPTQEDVNDEDNDEASIHCVTCGTDIHSKTAIRHMERCYNKMESKTSFASKYKTQIDDARMFCDYYNPKEETYCKRLQVLCPEHNPDSKTFVDDEVCGCPIGSLSSNQTFCRLTRRHCQAHFGWEKLRRAELDMERVKQWMKVDELIEHERQVKSSMSSRAGVMGLLLHSTFNHELEDRIQEVRAQQMQQHQQQQQQQRKSTHSNSANK